MFCWMGCEPEFVNKKNLDEAKTTVFSDKLLKNKGNNNIF